MADYRDQRAATSCCKHGGNGQEPHTNNDWNEAQCATSEVGRSETYARFFRSLGIARARPSDLSRQFEGPAPKYLVLDTRRGVADALLQPEYVPQACALQSSRHCFPSVIDLLNRTLSWNSPCPPTTRTCSVALCRP